MPPRFTKSTVQALERLAAAAGVRLSRDGKLWRVHTRQPKGCKPTAKKSAAALAHLWFALSATRADADELRAATAYDPGTDRQGRPDVPGGLSAWEAEALESLAITEEGI